MFKILIVDDESLIRYCLSATFRDSSFAVRTASTGQEALIALRENSFDLCILDLHLPDMGGIEIMHMVKATMPDAKIIVISGEMLTRETRSIVEENAVLYLEKPFDLDRVRSVVNLIRDQRTLAKTQNGSRPAERRRHVRRSADGLIRYSAVTPSGEAKAIDQEATLRDISQTGMQIFTDHPLEPGWWMMLSDGSRVNEGIVRWSLISHQPGSYHVGIQIGSPPVV